MIPILFDSSETSFTGNGLGRLTDAIKCEVTEERNGIYECELQYPITGALFSQMAEGCYIYTTHDDSKKPQAYQIYFRSAPLEGICTFRAWHISYALNSIIVAPFTAASAAEAIGKVKTASINANPFTFWTDKAVSAAYKLSTPRAARAILGGEEGSLLDTYGKGEYEFDMFNVKLYVNRGQNRGVSLRYGKNLTSLEQERDASNLYDGVVPYWSDSDGENVVSLNEVVYRTGSSTGPVVTKDFSDDFEEAPTTAQLRAAAQSWIDGTDAYEIKENVTIDFVALWQTEEYKDFANLQRIYLCDTVNIFYEKLGINATAKCIKVVYDSLRERYTSMELGTPKTTLARQILETTSDTLLKNVPSKNAMQSAIDKATEMIAGGFGGYIKFKYLSDGTPSEMLIMNTADEATATNIIRLNQNGIGFSTDGGTTYANAWTIDGNLNADFINAGTLSGVRVEATSGNIGRWEINTSALYKDVQGSDGYVYRVYFQPPLASGAKTWVLSCQKSSTQGNVGDNLSFNGVFILYSDGSVKFGSTTISASGDLSLVGDTSSTYSGSLEVVAGDGTKFLINGNGIYSYNSSNEELFSLALTSDRTGGTFSLNTAGGNQFYASPEILGFYFNGESFPRVRILANSTYQELVFADANGAWRARYSKDGANFYDANGTKTASYPSAATGGSVTRANLPSGAGDWSNYMRLGNVVIVNIFGSVKGGITNLTPIVTGLPTEAREAFGSIMNSQTNTSYAVSVRNNTIVVRTTLPSANAHYVGQIVYLTSD